MFPILDITTPASTKLSGRYSRGSGGQFVSPRRYWGLTALPDP